jgi:hypothetical protein
MMSSASYLLVTLATSLGSAGVDEVDDTMSPHQWEYNTDKALITKANLYWLLPLNWRQ